MTPKDMKDLKRAVFVDTLIAATALAGIAALSWDRYRDREAPTPPPVCLAPERTWSGMDAGSIVIGADGQMWICAPDADRSGIHCARMTERSSIECDKWAAGIRKRNAGRVQVHQ